MRLNRKLGQDSEDDKKIFQMLRQELINLQ